MHRSSCLEDLARRAVFAESFYVCRHDPVVGVDSASLAHKFAIAVRVYIEPTQYIKRFTYNILWLTGESLGDVRGACYWYGNHAV